MSKSNVIGDALESRARKALDATRIRQSGGGSFWKSDLRDSLRFVFECKATEKDYIRITKDIFLKAKMAARGVVGTGDNYKVGIIAEIDGMAVVIVELGDWVDLTTGEVDVSQFRSPSKASERRAKTRRSLSGS